MRKLPATYALIAALGLAATSGLPAEAKPNVLFIAIDDLKPVLGSYGDTVVQTPAMDRLAERGTVFLNNHCQQAVCAASRASLLTGLTPDHSRQWHFGETLRERTPDIETLPQYFKQHGYDTRGKGKIFDRRNIGPNGDARSWSVPYEPPSDWDIDPDPNVTTAILDFELD